VKRLACLPFALLFVIAGCSYGDTPVEPGALAVNGSSVSLSQINDELAFFADNPGSIDALAGAAVAVQPEGAADGIYATKAGSLLTSIHIQALVFTKFAADQDLEVTDDDRAAAEQQVDSQLAGGAADPTTGQAAAPTEMPATVRGALVDLVAANSAIQNALLADIELPDPPAVTDVEVQAAFEERLPTLSQTCVSAILIGFTDDLAAMQDPAFAPTEEERAAAAAQADEAVSRLAAGEEFAAVAADLSDDAASAAEGGVLGCGTVDEIGGLSASAVELEAGGVTDPEELAFGYQLVRVDSIEEPVFDEQAEAIRAELEQAASAAAQEESSTLLRGLFQARLEPFLATATIMVDPRLGTWRSDELAVVPPAGSTPAPTLPSDDAPVPEGLPGARAEG